jgi:nicotinamide phosphoribosyltransferase
MAWLLNFKGSDTMPAVAAINKYYRPTEPMLIATSVPASEHSLQCSYLYETADTELSDTNYVRGMLEAYPTGIVSVVADGFDFWRLVTTILPKMKDEIMARDGKLVIRPDSSPKTPVEILIGDPEAETEWERKGLIEVLWDIFGGTINSKGYKVLDSHIGAIYGDSITLEYQTKILQGLMDKGFATTNVVLGVGSYSLQYFTRDTFGMAIKATCMEIDGRVVPIYKAPKTDSGEKKSARGYLDVRYGANGYELVQNLPDYGEVGGHDDSAFNLVFWDGRILNRISWNMLTATAFESVVESLN